MEWAVPRAPLACQGFDAVEGKAHGWCGKIGQWLRAKGAPPAASGAEARTARHRRACRYRQRAPFPLPKRTIFAAAPKSFALATSAGAAAAE
jgi:hypothetical protein